LDKSEYRDRVIGFFFGAGGTSEWYYLNPVVDSATGRYGDFSPAFKKQYTNFLKEKYVTEENLKKSWKREDASFENPIIPDLYERRLAEIDERLYDPKFTGKDGHEKLSNYGMLLNADDFMYVADFYNAWHAATADSVIHFANVALLIEINQNFFLKN
jgi:hypothetical protein